MYAYTNVTLCSNGSFILGVDIICNRWCGITIAMNFVSLSSHTLALPIYAYYFIVFTSNCPCPRTLCKKKIPSYMYSLEFYNLKINKI